MMLLDKVKTRLRHVTKRRLFLRGVIIGFVAAVFLLPHFSPLGSAPVTAFSTSGTGPGLPEMPGAWVPVLMLLSIACFVKIRKALR